MKKGIVLIGMPGAGKTTIGRYISEKLNFKFVDMDEFIERSSKKSIKEIFDQGEDLFRAFETKTCEVLSRLDNVVISTGGGVVKKEENMDYYKDFVVVFINRPLELILDDIDVDSRPLLKDGKERIINIYRERIDLYNKYLDIEVINDGSIEDVAKDIILKTKEYLA